MSEHDRQVLNGLSEAVIGSAIAVHRELGPGLLESAYDACLAFELTDRGISLERQKTFPVTYRGMKMDLGYRVDLLVEESLVVELKAVDRLNANHEAQLLSYLKLSKLRLGLLINFNVKVLKAGVKRIVNGF